MKKYVILFLLMAVILGVICYSFPYEASVSNSLQATGVIGALIISTIALVYAVKEYQHHKKATEATIICQYMIEVLMTSILK